MVVSTNPEPDKLVFQSLLNSTVASLKLESVKDQTLYQTLLGSKLEGVVYDVMKENSKGTPFENTIEYIGGQKFPDIIARKLYGVEVKATKQDHWTTTGNSVLEGTRVDDIERIYMLFGKMTAPVDFKCRPYEECLSEVVVTHSPRYLIDMDLHVGQTIFDKLDIPYDTLRNMQNPVKPIIDYYRRFLEPGEEVWWLDQEEPKPTGLIIKLWNNLTQHERNAYRTLSMVYFPEIFSNQYGTKFDRIAVWLVNMHGVVCRNVRDIFTAGGRGPVNWKGVVYQGIPQIVQKMVESIGDIKQILDTTDDENLNEYWKSSFKNKYVHWIDLVIKNTKHFRLSLNLREVLMEGMGISV
jgi:hypothetical protein